MYDSADLKKAHLLSYIKLQFVHQAKPEEQEEGHFVPRLESEDRQIVSSDGHVAYVTGHYH